VIIENVPEFLTWGALDKNGKPIPAQKGKIFLAFINALREHGYTVDWKILCAADYGDPTTRKRLFIQAVKGRKKIMWPQITHIDGAGDNLMGYKPWRAAKDIIDWSVPSTSIFDRKKPLVPATMRRIAAGIQKYWGEGAKPFLAVLYGSNDVRSLDLPLPSVTTSGAHHALVEPMIVDFTHSNKPFSVNEPLRTIVTKCHFGLLQNSDFDINFRMLKNHELKRAQGFEANYILTGNATEQTKQIGNSVPPNTAKALVKSAMSA
jgi:DNA (cytosine-5)-methyltransferase 1